MLISFSSEYTDGTYWCSLDQADFDKCQSPISFAGLGNGAHSFQVYAQTPRGVDVNDPAVYSWTVDSVPPVVTITNLNDLPSLTNQVSMTFLFASSKTGTFKCSIDGAASTDCSSPMTYTVIEEGLHTFSVTAIDKVGNVSGSPARFQWTLDMTPPTTQIVAIEPNESLSKNPARSISFSASETSNFECAIDHGAFAACESPVALQNLSEGSHWFEVRAVDLAGNVGASVSSSWTQDYTAPIVTFGAITPSAGLTNSSQASVEFFINETGTTYCQIDSQDPVVCSSPVQFSMPEDGEHHISVYAQDAVGNRGETVSVGWTVDATAPLISFGTILPSGATYQKTGNISAQIVLSENVSLSASLNGAPLASFTNPIELTGLNDGSYTLSVSGYDQAGNLSNTIEYSFVVDTQAPVLTLTGNGGNLVNVDSRTIEISSNEQASFECAMDEAGFEACQSPVHYSGLADGDHTLIVRATDLAGNQSQASHSWSVDTVAPTTLESHNQAGSAITFSLVANESPATFLCSMDGQVFVDCATPASYSGLSAGSHTFVAKAVDSAGNVDPVGASYSFTVYPPIQTSILSSNPAGSVVKSKTMSISFSANQPTSGFVCSLDGAAFSSCSSPASYSGLGDGNHSFTVKAIDQAGTMDAVGASKAWTVDTTAPTITSFTTTTTTNSITVTWFLNEAGTGKVNYGVGTALNQATVETSTTATTYSIKLTGLSSNTMYSIQVSGKDAAGNTYTGNVQTARTNR